MRDWVENRLKFDQELDEDAQDELLDTLAMLTPGEPQSEPLDFSSFKTALKLLPTIYEEVRPYLPTLRSLFS